MAGTNCYSHVSACYDETMMGAKYGKQFHVGTAEPDGPAFEAALGDAAIFEDVTAAVKAGTYKLQCGDIVQRPGHVGYATGQGDQISQYGYPGYLLAASNLLRTRQEAMGKRIPQLVNKGMLPPSANDHVTGGMLRDPTDDAAGHAGLQSLLQQLLTRDHLKEYDDAWNTLHDAPQPWQTDNTVSFEDMKKGRAKDDYRVYRPKDRGLVKAGCCPKAVLEIEWHDIVKIPYPPEFHGTYYEIELKVSEVSPEPKLLATSNAWVRIPGGHTHYGCIGAKVLELPLDDLENLGPDGVMGWAKTEIGMEFFDGPSPDASTPVA